MIPLCLSDFPPPVTFGPREFKQFLNRAIRFVLFCSVWDKTSSLDRSPAVFIVTESLYIERVVLSVQKLWAKFLAKSLGCFLHLVKLNAQEKVQQFLTTFNKISSQSLLQLTVFTKTESFSTPPSSFFSYYGG